MAEYMSCDKMSCDENPLIKYQCGIPTRKGVVPSEQGHGYFCGNVVGDDWVSNRIVEELVLVIWKYNL